MSLLSVIIITKNEAHNITPCLQSVDFADEIIIVDSGSTDGTVELCKPYTDKILVTDWPGYGAQKQRALELATGEWVLALDADERVTPALKASILSTIPNTRYNGFEIQFSSEYCGKTIRFGDWWNDRQAVLFRRSAGRFTDSLVHESIIIRGPIGKLTGKIHHIAFPNLYTVLRKMNDYSSMSAAQKQLKGKQGGLFKAISHAIFAFIRGYFLRLGFLDGKEGFLLAFSNAEGTYYRYLKLMYLNLDTKRQTKDA